MAGPSYVQELAIPGNDLTRGRSLEVPWVADENKIRDYAHSELMKGRYPREEIELVIDWTHDDVIVEMLGLTYGDPIYYKDTAMGARGLYCDDYYRVVSFQHNVTIGAVPFTTVKLRPAHLFHNIDKVTWDDFNRDDGSSLGTTPTGDPWSVIAGSWSIASNRAKATTGGSATNMVSYDLGTADMKILVQIAEMGTASTFALQYRLYDSNNYWLVAVSSATGLLNVAKVVAGALTNKVTGIAVGSEPVELRVVVQGDRHRVWVGRKLILDTTDSAHNTRTKVGFYNLYTTAAAEFDFISAIGLAA